MEVSAGHMLPPESDDLRPLPPVLQSGLGAVAIIASISLLASTALFCHLTYKIIRWKHRTSATQAKSRPLSSGKVYHEPPSPSFDLSLGLAERHFHANLDAVENPTLAGHTQQRAASWPWTGRYDARPSDEQAVPTASEIEKKPELNQFLVLLYNLLLADMHQSMAFMLNAVWVKNNVLAVQSSTCWAQGLFVSIGDLSASLFIAGIAIHTYSVISRGYKPPQRVVNITCVCIWVFAYGVTVIGVAATRNGKAVGGFYVRASAWCWINKKYETLRLITHSLFIFMTLALTSLLYILVFLSFRRQQTLEQRRRIQKLKLSRGQHSSQSSQVRLAKSGMDVRLTTITMTPTGTVVSEDDSPDMEINEGTVTSEWSRHPGFLIYPIIYVLCTLPLALGRIATMAGANVPLSYFCASAALITSNGWLDVLLWGSTRHSIVFGDVDDQDVGVNTFSFLRTPTNRRFGNIVRVEGGVTRKENTISDGESTNGIPFRGFGNGETNGTNASSGRKGSRMTTVLRDWRELGNGSGAMGASSANQESLQKHDASTRNTFDNTVYGGNGVSGLAIRMELETTVVYEIEDVPTNVPRSRQLSTSAPSYDDADLPYLPPIE